MKKLFLVLIILAIFMTGCANSSGEQNNLGAISLNNYAVINNLKYENLATTSLKVTVKQTDTVIRSYGYDLKIDDLGVINITLSDGTFLQGELINGAESIYDYYNGLGTDNYPTQYGYWEYLQYIKFNSPDKLFNLNSSTVKATDYMHRNDNTDLYTIYLYEGQVKNALPCLEQEFKTIKDVSNLVFEVIQIGTKTQINLNMSVYYLGDIVPTDLSFNIVYTKTVRIID